MEINEAIKQLKISAKKSAFNQTVELHINLGTDPTKQEQAVRTQVTLPHGTGKEKKVLLIASTSVKEADLQGGEEIVEKIVSGTLKPKIDFDAVVATPEMMPKLAKVARILGPVGMMPNPKTGSVAVDPAKAITEIKKGQLDLRVEKGAAVIHTIIGKLSFDDQKLSENFKTIIDALNTVRPAKLKGKFIREINLKSTQSKAFPVEI